MRNRLVGIFFCALLLSVSSVALARADLPLYVHPEDRAAGNRLDDAVHIGRTLLTVQWPATVTQVRVDGVSGHRVAGITISAVKFHRTLDGEGFLREVEALVSKTFEHSDVEEVDVWATSPIPVPKGAIVSGDYAVSTTRTVFACTVPRDHLSHLHELLHGKADVYWEPEFAAHLAGKSTTAGMLSEKSDPSKPHADSPKPHFATPDGTWSTRGSGKTAATPSKS